MRHRWHSKHSGVCSNLSSTNQSDNGSWWHPCEWNTGTSDLMSDNQCLLIWLLPFNATPPTHTHTKNQQSERTGLEKVQPSPQWHIDGTLLQTTGEGHPGIRGPNGVNSHATIPAPSCETEEKGETHLRPAAPTLQTSILITGQRRQMQRRHTSRYYVFPSNLVITTSHMVPGRENCKDRHSSVGRHWGRMARAPSSILHGERQKPWRSCIRCQCNPIQKNGMC